MPELGPDGKPIQANGTVVTLDEATAKVLKDMGIASVPEAITQLANAKKSVEEGTRKIGEQGNELGTLRKKVADLEAAKPPETKVEPPAAEVTKELDATKAALTEQQQKLVDEAINKLSPEIAGQIEADHGTQLQFIRDVLGVSAAPVKRSLFSKPPVKVADLKTAYRQALRLTIEDERRPSPTTQGRVPVGSVTGPGVGGQPSQRVAGGDVFAAGKAHGEQQKK